MINSFSAANVILLFLSSVVQVEVSATAAGLSHRCCTLSCGVWVLKRGETWHDTDVCLSVRLSVTLRLIYWKLRQCIVTLRVCVGGESCTCSLEGGTSYSLVQTLLLYDISFSDNAQCHRQAILWCTQYDRLKRKTNKRTDPSLKGPRHSYPGPHGFLSRIIGSLSALKPKMPVPAIRTLLTAVTAYACPLVRPNTASVSISSFVFACTTDKHSA